MGKNAYKQKEASFFQGNKSIHNTNNLREFQDLEGTWHCGGLPRCCSIKNPPAGDTRDVGSTPGSGRPPDNLLQCSCLAEGEGRGWGKVEEADKILGSLSSCMLSDLSQQLKTRGEIEPRDSETPGIDKIGCCSKNKEIEQNSSFWMATSPWPLC